jgi:hemerythrin-like domain-containing protein
MSHYHTPNLPQSGAPVDIYRRIHKALRFCMSDTLSRVSRLDIGDRGEVVSVLAQVREMAILCATHVAHEDTFVHPAMEARFPGTAKATAAEHAHHKYACRKIIALGDAVYNARKEDRESLVSQLYHYISLFVAESLGHMNAEETDNNMLLWATHTDAELIAIQQAIVDSMTADEKAVCMRWMLPALNPTERVELMEEVLKDVPSEFYNEMLAGMQPYLAASDFRKLTIALHGEHKLAA